MAYEIRAMTLGEVLDTAFRLVRDHAATLIGISLTVTLPTQLAVYLLQNTSNPNAAAVIAGGLGFALYILVVSPIASAAITHAISEVYLGRSASYGASFARGVNLLAKLMGTAFLVFVILVPAFLLLIIPGLYLSIAFMLVYQVLVIEGSAGMTAIKRSYQLTKGNMLRVLAVYFVAALLMGVVSMALQLVSARIPYAGVLIDAVVQGVMTAYLSAAMVVIYFDIRCRKEAFDLEYLAHAVTDAQPRAVPAV